jgi:hypothetical protein
MKRFSAFLLLVSIGLLYGLAFDSAINSMHSGQICHFLSEASCLIPQAMDRWLTIIGLLMLAPVSLVAVTHWLLNSRRMVGALFGWIFVLP